MLDDYGHIIHIGMLIKSTILQTYCYNTANDRVTYFLIDFGFILDISPGGIKFESSPFKLTTEMIQVMGGSAGVQPFQWFSELCIKAYLALRYVG